MSYILLYKSNEILNLEMDLCQQLEQYQNLCQQLEQYQNLLFNIQSVVWNHQILPLLKYPLSHYTYPDLQKIAWAQKHQVERDSHQIHRVNHHNDLYGFSSGAVGSDELLYKNNHLLYTLKQHRTLLDTIQIQHVQHANDIVCLLQPPFSDATYQKLWYVAHDQQHDDAQNSYDIQNVLSGIEIQNVDNSNYALRHCWEAQRDEFGRVFQVRYRTETLKERMFQGGSSIDPLVDERSFGEWIAPNRL
jgi:hypothetical protein